MRVLIEVFIFVLLIVFFSSCTESEVEEGLNVDSHQLFDRNYAIKKCHEFFSQNINDHRYETYVKLDSFYAVFNDFSNSIHKDLDVRRVFFKTALSSNNNVFLSTKRIKDKRVVTKKYLRSHIERSVDNWKSSWCRHLNFEEFKIYLLPYRSEMEPFEEWDLVFDEHFPWIKELNKDSLTAYEACALINDSLISKMSFVYELNTIPQLSYSQSLSFGAGSCTGLANLTTALMRYAGLPVATVFNMDNHRSNVFYNTDGSLIHFPGALKSIPTSTRLSLQKDAKLFLRKYHKNAEDNRSIVFKETKNPFSIDVSSRLLACINIDSSFLNQRVAPNDCLVLLSNRSKNAVSWTPVDYSYYQFGKPIFNSVGIRNAYLVARLKKNKYEYVSDPFYVEIDSTCHFFVTDTTKRSCISVNRKCKLYAPAFSYAKKVNNCELHASNDSLFRTYCKLHKITKSLPLNYEGGDLNFSCPYKYYRIKSYHKGFFVADIVFFNGDSCVKGGTVYSSSMMKHPEHAFDGRIETHSSGTGREQWLAKSFRKKMLITSYEILFRNNQNIIVSGDTYSLYYWDDGWVFCDEAIAGDNHFVTFKDVPKNALLYVKNQSGGVENMGFGIYEGKQKWIR